MPEEEGDDRITHRTPVLHRKHEDDSQDTEQRQVSATEIV